jgi:hypothetical protein
VNVVALEDTAQIRLIRVAVFEPLDRRRLIAKGFQKGKGKLLWVKGGFGKLGNGFFDFNCIHIKTTSYG